MGTSSVPGMRSELAGPLTEHAPPATSTARSSSQTCKQPEFLFLVGADAFSSFHRERLSYSCDSNSQTIAESLTQQETSGTPSSDKRGNFQIPPSPYIHSLDSWSHGDPSRGWNHTTANRSLPRQWTRLAASQSHTCVADLSRLQQAQRLCGL